MYAFVGRGLTGLHLTSVVLLSVHSGHPNCKAVYWNGSITVFCTIFRVLFTKRPVPGGEGRFVVPDVTVTDCCQGWRGP